MGSRGRARRRTPRRRDNRDGPPRGAARCPCSTELVVFTPILAGLSTCSDLCANSSALTMMSEQVQAALNAMLHAASAIEPATEVSSERSSERVAHAASVHRSARHALAVAAKRRRIAAHPAHGEPLVLQPKVASRLPRACGRHCSEAECREPVVDGDDHEVAVGGHHGAVFSHA